MSNPSRIVGQPLPHVLTALDVPVGTKAYVDGIEIKNAGSACLADGWVEYAPDPIRAREDDPEQIYTERTYGKVEIVFPDNTRLP